MNRKLERYLRATRPDHGVPSLDDAMLIALRADSADLLPGLDPIPELIFISSRQRRWEFLRPNETHPSGLLIADTALEDAMLDLQHLMMVKHDGGPALTWLLAADACRREKADKAYLLFAATALEFSHKLRSLATLRARRSDNITRRFLLFHELGHVAVARRLPWVEDIRAVVEISRLQFLEHVRGRLTAPQQMPPGYKHGSGVPIEGTPVEMLNANFERYLEIGSEAGPLDEELTCDWTAALALAGIPMDQIGDDNNFGKPLAGTWRQAADALLLATRLVRILGFLTGIRQLARTLSGNVPRYWSERYQVELSIRLNVISNLAAAFNEAELARRSFALGTGFPAETPTDQIVAAFNAAIARDARLFHDRVFLLNEVIEPALDPAQLATDLEVEDTRAFLDMPVAAADRFRVDIDRQLEHL